MLACLGSHVGESGEGGLGPEPAVRPDCRDSQIPKARDRLRPTHARERLGVLVEGELGDDRERGHGAHRFDRGDELVQLEERLDHVEVDASALQDPGLLAEDLAGVLRALAPRQVAERPDRAGDEHRLPGDIARLARKAHSRVQDLLQPVVEELGRELAPVCPERVRLDQLGARANEPEVNPDDCLGSLEIRLLRAAKAGHRRGDERAGAAVGDDHAAFVEPLLRPAHEPSLARRTRAERPELVVAGLHDAHVRLGHLLPGAR